MDANNINMESGFLKKLHLTVSLFVLIVFTTLLCSCTSKTPLASTTVSVDPSANNNTSTDISSTTVSAESNPTSSNQTIQAVSSTSTHNSTATISNSTNNYLSLFGPTKNITSAQLLQLTSGLSYQAIINKFGPTTNASFVNGYCQYFIKDADKLLALHYSNLDDICKYSGEELLANAFDLKSSFNTNSNYEIHCYFADVNSNLIIYSRQGNIQCGKFSVLKNCSITYLNGNAASLSDIKVGDGLTITTTDTTRESYPPGIDVTKIIIEK
jgi:hypothetical protein